MTAEEAVDVFWRAVEAGHFDDLEARLRAVRDLDWDARKAKVVGSVTEAFRARVAELLGLPTDSTWVDGLVGSHQLAGRPGGRR